MLSKEKRTELEKLALKIRIGTLEEIKARGAGHLGGSFSIADLLAVLYGEIMNYDVNDPAKDDRDKLVCSKGHAGPAVYAALAAKGFIPWDELVTLNQPHTNLPSHCDRLKTKGIDATTGSLGQGTSEACGIALGDKLKGYSSKTYLIVGDGESDEGQVWEAAMFAASKKLTNLVWLVDDNKKQLDGYTKDIINHFDFRAKMEAFGFDAIRIDGNDLDALYEALTMEIKDRPLAIILDTVKGKGIKEAEETMNNHSMSPGDEKCDAWIAELQDRLAALE